MGGILERLPASLADDPLIHQALRHVSTGRGNNERLEFLGDAVIGMCVADWLYRNRPHEDEGGMSRLRSSLVSRRGLARVARRLDVGSHIKMSHTASERQEYDNPRILSSTIEALVGAVHRLGGWAVVSAFVDDILTEAYAELPARGVDARDPKTRLQEWAQTRRRRLPEYRLVEAPQGETNGFTVLCVMTDMAATGCGHTRKAAELDAAQTLLDRLPASRRALHGDASVVGSHPLFRSA